MKNLLVLQLNEVNFDIVKKYTAEGKLKNFKKILDNFEYYETTSEDKYENLEPWIQWYSFYVGKSFNDHKVFYLNESKENDLNFFKLYESKLGEKVALFFPMNLKNSFNKSSVFLPDPWTQTKVNANFIMGKFHQSTSDIIKKKRIC